jgi:two-component system, chemotaxis family, protein-glutamate methylesterase/glutaminase
MLITATGRVRLNRSPLLIQRPSVDITMQAAAEVYGSRAVGVLLTGMGRDGARGMHAIRHVGGHTIAQSEASCAIYGMPRAAIQIGAAAEVLAPHQIGPRLAAIVAARFAALPRAREAPWQ